MKFGVLRKLLTSLFNTLLDTVERKGREKAELHYEGNGAPRQFDRVHKKRKKANNNREAPFERALHYFTEQKE